jgi:hypothetical protein
MVVRKFLMSNGEVIAGTLAVGFAFCVYVLRYLSEIKDTLNRIASILEKLNAKD